MFQNMSDDQLEMTIEEAEKNLGFCKNRKYFGKMMYQNRPIDQWIQHHKNMIQLARGEISVRSKAK